MKFSSKVELHGKTATGVVVPPEVVASLGKQKRPAVRVTIGSHTYRSTVSFYGGAFLLPLSAENRTAAGVSAGDQVEVDIEPDDQPREVEVPADLAAALSAAPGLREAFDALSFTYRKEHVRSVEDAKIPATRERRIAKAVSAVSEKLG